MHFPVQGQSKLKTSRLEDIRSDRSLYLFDAFKNVYTPLNKAGDSIEIFVPEAGYETERFALVSVLDSYESSPTFNSNLEGRIAVYGTNQSLVIDANEPTTAEVFTLQGQLVGTYSNKSAHTITIQSGAYLVRVYHQDTGIHSTHKVVVY